MCNIKYDQKLTSNHPLEHKINTNLPIIAFQSENNKLKELTSIRQEIYVIILAVFFTNKKKIDIVKAVW